MNADFNPWPILIGWFAFLLMILAYCIETLRYRWLDFEELPLSEQTRLLEEAKKTVYTIGNRTISPDPRVMQTYTKLPRRRP